VQVVFTSGGTEANNLFITGAAATREPAQVAVSAIEHPCVLEPAKQLKRRGWTVAEIGVDAEGVVRADALAAALQAATGIVSIMLANNETGVIQPVAALGEQARAARAVMHTDAVQAFGKIPVRFGELNVQAMSISSHKIYGPKGAGALIVDKRLDLQPLLAGGGHERGMRSGTENVPAIVGFGAAAELAKQGQDAEAGRLAPLRARLEAGVLQRGGRIFGAGAPRLPNTSYFAFPGVEGETLVMQLDAAGFAVASGAACSSHHSGPSRVLLAMGVESSLAGRAVRASLGRGNDAQQVDSFLAALDAVLDRLKRLAAMAA
jgi:cysteine desulfurase